MARLASPIVFGDFSSALIDDLSVSKFLLPKNAVRKAINAVFDRPRGAISQRYGTTSVGDVVSAAATVNGLHNYRSSTGSGHKLFTQVGTVAYYLSGTSWVSSLTGMTNTKTRFFTYLDTMVALNGTDAVKGWNGSAWIATGGSLDISNFPVTKFATILNSRVVAVGNSSAPDTAYLSSLEASGAVSWTLGNKTLKVSPNDGAGNLTGVTGNGRVVLFFKERGLYRYDDTELQRIGYVGTTSNESIINDDQGITYFFGQGANGVGFYATNGAKPIKISRVITKYVEAILPSYYGSIAGYTNGSIIEWNVGTIIIDGITYTNAAYVYSISDKTWTIFHRGGSFRVFSQYIDTSSNITVVGGDTDGFVQTMNSGTTDNGVDIAAEVELAPITFTTRARTKSPEEIWTFSEHYQGLRLHMKVDDGQFEELGTIDDYNKQFTLNTIDIFRGHEFFLKLTSINGGTPWQFSGFEFPSDSVTDEDYRVSVD